MTLTVPLLKDIRNQAPQTVCEMRPVNVRTTLLPNHRITTFDNVEVRRALALALDRQAFITIISEGTGDMGGVMLPPPEGAWGHLVARVDRVGALSPTRVPGHAVRTYSGRPSSSI